MADMMDFSEALKELKNGERVARAGWNGKNMFIYLVNGAYIDEDFLNKEPRKFKIAKKGFAKFNSHIDMKTADGSICIGWLASQTDLLANDWVVIDNHVIQEE